MGNESKIAKHLNIKIKVYQNQERRTVSIYKHIQIRNFEHYMDLNLYLRILKLLGWKFSNMNKRLQKHAKNLHLIQLYKRFDK